MDTQQFQERILQAMEKAIVDWVGDGTRWIQWEHAQRISIVPWLREAFGRLDAERMIGKIADELETRMAHQVAVHMLTEIGTDVKKVMADQDFRAELRVLVKAKLRERGHA